MYRIVIQKESVELFQSRGYIYENEEKLFSSLYDLNAWLKEEYEGRKKQPMYVDYGEEAFQTGYVYSFRAYDNRSNERHWMSIEWIVSHNCIDQKTGEVVTFD